MTTEQQASRAFGRPEVRAGGPVVIAVLTLGATLATLGPGTTGPGVTCDEWYHVGVGKELVTALRHQGPQFFAPGNIARNFRWDPEGPPAHPPLGNWLLGWAYHLFDLSPDESLVGSVLPARFAPAVALAILVLLVGLWSVRVDGPWAGTVAAAAVVFVPRVFGHGHLAALDTFTALFCVASILAVAWADTRARLGWYALAGFVWGLALLTRMHGFLVAPPIVLWMVWRLRRRAGPPLAIWAGTGLATFFAGWPWLWIAPWAHLRQYLGTATHRLTVHVFYLGRVWDDHQVPWHYPIVMFLVVVPAGLLLLGGAGLWAKRRADDDPAFRLIVATLAFMLLTFAWPGTPVYDGVRLFLTTLPLWAVAVGAGARWLVEHRRWRGVPQAARLAIVGSFVALQAFGLVACHPCHLSHYNLLVGGLGGAEKLGFEVDYWGHGVRESLVAEAVRRGPGTPILFAPSLAPWQAHSVGVASPSAAENEVPFEGWPGDWNRPIGASRYVIVYHRRADLPDIPRHFESAWVIREHLQQGVWLSRLVEIESLLEGYDAGGTRQPSAPVGPWTIGPRRPSTVD